MINSQRLLETFLELVQINSETGHEEVIQPILKKKFEELGLNVTEDHASEKSWLGANNLICTLPATSAKEDVSKIYFTSHMDTVVPGINIKPQIKEDGYIYSDGSTILGADDKAGLAAIIETIQYLNENEIPHGQIQFIITVGEESGLKGVKELDSTYIDAEFGYAVDASQPVGTTVVGAPTQMVINTTILGKTAHASTPSEGISAINIAAKAISRMKLGQIDDYTTANIGKFHGGSATNIVADEVVLEAEARSHDNKSIEQQVIIEKSYPGFKLENDDKVTQFAINSARELGLAGDTVIAGGGSDGSIINTFGIPTVILGVGYEHIHTTSERISVNSLNQLAKQIVKIIDLVAKS